MTTNTRERIISYIRTHHQVSPKELGDYLGIGSAALFRQLKKLQASGTITKRGTSPRVYYSLQTAVDTVDIIPTLPAETYNLIEAKFLWITPLGMRMGGVEGFAAWCSKHDLPIQKTAQEYFVTTQKYNQFKVNGLIDGLPKLKNTFGKVYLDELYYLDFYAIERFGKTKLGGLLLYAKQSQQMTLIEEVYRLIAPCIQQLISSKHIDAVGFIPPTLARLVQFQKELERLLALDMPKVDIIKVTNGIPVAQKTLSHLSDRVENAAHTIVIASRHAYRNVLLIDDALGSGATLNETARKMKQANMVSGKLIGVVITGSFKGFDVLNEV